MSRFLNCICCIPCIPVNFARAVTERDCNKSSKIGRCWSIGMGANKLKPQNRCEWFCQAISTDQQVELFDVLTCGDGGLDLNYIYESPVPNQQRMD